MYHTVIFDLDGTLLDTIRDLAQACSRTCLALGLPAHSIEEYLSMVGHGIPSLIHAMLPPSARTPETEARALELFSADYGAHSMEATAPYPGIRTMLQNLRAAGVTMAVCSNKAEPFTQALVSHYFPGLFSHVQGKLPGVPTKPDPAGVKLILNTLRADPARTLYVGDSDTDMETGANAGLTTCGVTWGFRSRDTLIRAGACQLAETAQQLEALILS